MTNFWFSPRLYPLGASDEDVSLAGPELASVAVASLASVCAGVVVSVIVRPVSEFCCTDRGYIGQDVSWIKLVPLTVLHCA